MADIVAFYLNCDVIGSIQDNEAKSLDSSIAELLNGIWSLKINLVVLEIAGDKMSPHGGPYVLIALWGAGY